MSPHADVDDEVAAQETQPQDEVESDSEDGDEDGDEDDEEYFDVRKRFFKILRDLKAGAWDLHVLAERNAFLEANGDVLALKTPDEGQNLLHILAASDKDVVPAFEQVEPLVEILTKLDEKLLAEADVDNKTPLYIAASRAKKKQKLLRAMCEFHATAHGDPDSVLRIQYINKETCIHVALRKKAPQATLLDLIERAGPKTLCVQDNKGNTPLHIAVDYELCIGNHLKVVEALVRRGDAAMDLRNLKNMSPYRYYEDTFTEAMNRAKKAQEPQLPRGVRDLDRESHGQPEGSVIGGGNRRDQGPAFRPPPPTPRQDNASFPMPTQKAQTFSNAPPGKYGAGVSRTNAGPLDALKGKPTVDVAVSREVGAADTRTPISIFVKKRPGFDTKKSTRAGAKTSPGDEKPSPEVGNAVKSFLKLYYLRTRKHDIAIEFLYGHSPEYQIYFDLFGCPPTINHSWFKDANYLRFDDMLQYIAVPQVRLEESPVPRRPNKKPPKQDGNGRTDLNLLFKWLKNDKGVKTVLRVIVDDLQEPSHSEEAIESALAGLGVEIWDWRKTDLSSEVICNVAPNARIVHLYWSGNNSVLRSWSEAEGLCKLANLAEVHLNVNQGLEKLERTNVALRVFRERMLKHCPTVTIDASIPRASSEGNTAQSEAMRTEQEVRHRWLITMDEFSEFLQNMERNAKPKIVLEEPITVALIDDGIDMNDAALGNRIVGGRSFCHRNAEQNLNQSYYVSSGGHGTAMASLICRICPSVRLYVLKLDETSAEPGKRGITAESAARAVRDAVDRGVHIISMSWTIERTESNSAGIAELEQAIQLATEEGILMFCAATDQGAFKDRSYPAASSKKIFKIGAAEASGTAMKWLGDQRAVDFIFPGHNVVKERPGEVPADRYTTLTGSSVATALAAGLAAVILYCVQVGAIPPQARALGVTQDVFRDLKKHDFMRTAFLDIGTTEESEKKYIAVWERFKEVVQMADQEPKDKWIDIVTRLAALLMRRKLAG